MFKGNDSIPPTTVIESYADVRPSGSPPKLCKHISTSVRQISALWTKDEDWKEQFWLQGNRTLQTVSTPRRRTRMLHPATVRLQYCRTRMRALSYEDEEESIGKALRKVWHAERDFEMHSGSIDSIRPVYTTSRRTSINPRKEALFISICQGKIATSGSQSVALAASSFITNNEQILFRSWNLSIQRLTL